MATALETHLLCVARCDIVAQVLDGRASSHPCSRVVLHQWAGVDDRIRVERWRELHQIPEPWVGHIERARVLFVSSNPSISGEIDLGSGRAPGLTWNHADDEIVDRYENAFDKWITDGTRVAGKRPTAYWREVKSRAQELLPGVAVQPGIDYALTEAVRCKSKREDGVAEALSTCSKLYLDQTLRLSRASLVVFLGSKAERAAHEVLGIPKSFGSRPQSEHVTDADVGGLRRTVGFLPHPNFRGKRTVAASWTSDEVERARAAARASA